MKTPKKVKETKTRTADEAIPFPFLFWGSVLGMILGALSMILGLIIVVIILLLTR